MDGKIYVVDGGDLHTLSETEYEAEARLQKLLGAHPDLLAGDQMNENHPRQWLLVDREFGIPDDEDVSNRWALDHLFLDQDGKPTLVEVKRSTDTRIRRRVVGQMMDYAANAVSYGDIHQIRRSFTKQISKDFRSEEAVLEDTLGATEPDVFWGNVETNLDRGAIRMVFVADRIPTELRRIVEFLNEQMHPAEVLAVEVKKYVGDNLKTLVPRVHGQTASAQQKKERDKTSWDKSTVFDEIESRTSEKKRRLARRIFDWAQGRGYRITWSSGKVYGGFFVQDGDQKLFKVTVGAQFGTRCPYYDAIVGADEWTEFQRRMDRLGLSFPDDRTSNREPNRILPSGDHDEWWQAFKDVYEWLPEHRT